MILRRSSGGVRGLRVGIGYRVKEGREGMHMMQAGRWRRGEGGGGLLWLVRRMIGSSMEEGDGLEERGGGPWGESIAWNDTP